MKRIYFLILFFSITTSVISQDIDSYYLELKGDSSILDENSLNFTFYDTLMNFEFNLQIYKDNICDLTTVQRKLKQGYFRVDTINHNHLPLEYPLPKNINLKRLDVVGNENINNKIVILDGIYKGFDKKNNMKFAVSFNKGKPSGTWKFYYSNTLISTMVLHPAESKNNIEYIYLGSPDFMGDFRDKHYMQNGMKKINNRNDTLLNSMLIDTNKNYSVCFYSVFSSNWLAHLPIIAFFEVFPHRLFSMLINDSTSLSVGAKQKLFYKTHEDHLSIRSSHSFKKNDLFDDTEFELSPFEINYIKVAYDKNKNQFIVNLVSENEALNDFETLKIKEINAKVD